MSFIPLTGSLVATGDQNPLSSTEPTIWERFCSFSHRYTPPLPSIRVHNIFTQRIPGQGMEIRAKIAMTLFLREIFSKAKSDDMLKRAIYFFLAHMRLDTYIKGSLSRILLLKPDIFHFAQSGFDQVDTIYLE